MVVVSSGVAGAEEWSCPSCGRRILLRWPPRSERVVLHPGDDGVVHVGGRRGEPAADPTPAELSWLRDNGILWV
jgi:hypothetical protein